MEKIKKRGQVSWPIGKLMSIILAVFFFVLVLYGYSNGLFKPLVSDTASRIDQITFFFNNIFNRDANSASCFDRDLSKLSGGDKLLEQVDFGVGDEKIEFRSCGRSCEIVAGEEELYSYSLNNFKWMGNNFYDSIPFGYDLESLEKHNEIYNLAVDSIGEDSLSILREKSINTPEFILVGDAEGKGFLLGRFFSGDKDVRMTWKGFAWFLEIEGEYYKTIVEDEVALRWFYDQVKDPLNDDEVYYKDSALQEFKSIGELIGGNNELDNDEEFEKLVEEFNKFREQIIELNLLSSSEIGELSKKTNGKSFFYKGKEFSLEFGGPFGSPAFLISSGDETYVLEIDLGISRETKGIYKIKNSFYGKYSLKGYPLRLYKLENNKLVQVSGEEFYRLNLDFFSQSKKGRIVYNFMEAKC